MKRIIGALATCAVLTLIWFYYRHISIENTNAPVYAQQNDCSGVSRMGGTTFSREIPCENTPLGKAASVCSKYARIDKTLDATATHIEKRRYKFVVFDDDFLFCKEVWLKYQAKIKEEDAANTAKVAAEAELKKQNDIKAVKEFIREYENNP